MENIDVKKLKEGNKTEFEKIYYEFFDVLFALSFQYTLNRTISEEIVQDSFLRLWEIKNGLADDTNIKNFLYIITKNNCLNYLRNQQTAWKYINHVKEKEYFYLTKLLYEDDNNYVEFAELMNSVSEAIEKLPEEQKATFKLNRLNGMKYKEIADQLQISIKTVESRISKALKFLRIELKDYLK